VLHLILVLVFRKKRELTHNFIAYGDMAIGISSIGNIEDFTLNGQCRSGYSGIDCAMILMDCAMQSASKSINIIWNNRIIL
jgi:hypothetical protein